MAQRLFRVITQFSIKHCIEKIQPSNFFFAPSNCPHGHLWGSETLVLVIYRARVLPPQTSTPSPHWAFTWRQPCSWSLRQSFRAASRRMCLRVLSRGGAPVRGRPESTKYIGSELQLLGSQWIRAVLAVLGSWIQACFSTAFRQVRLYYLGMTGVVKTLDQAAVTFSLIPTRMTQVCCAGGVGDAVERLPATAPPS